MAGESTVQQGLTPGYKYGPTCCCHDRLNSLTCHAAGETIQMDDVTITRRSAVARASRTVKSCDSERLKKDRFAFFYILILRKYHMSKSWISWNSFIVGAINRQ